MDKLGCPTGNTALRNGQMGHTESELVWWFMRLGLSTLKVTV